MTNLLNTMDRIAAAMQNNFEGIAVLYQVLDIHAELVRKHATQEAWKQLQAA